LRWNLEYSLGFDPFKLFDGLKNGGNGWSPKFQPQTAGHHQVVGGSRWIKDICSSILFGLTMFTMDYRNYL
jgi:hypothetical protein